MTLTETNLGDNISLKMITHINAASTPAATLNQILFREAKKLDVISGLFSG